MTEILETFPRVFCLPKSRINENGGKMFDVKLLLPNRIANCNGSNIQPLQLAPAVAPGSETLTHDVSKFTSS